MLGHICTYMIDKGIKGKWQKRKKLQSLQFQEQNSFEKWTTAQETNKAVCGVSVALVNIFQMDLWYAQF